MTSTSMKCTAAWMLVEVDVIGRDGEPPGANPAFPRDQPALDGTLPIAITGARSIPLGELASGTRLRITLWFLLKVKARSAPVRCAPKGTACCDRSLDGALGTITLRRR